MPSSMIMLSEDTVEETEMTSPWTTGAVNQSANSVPQDCIILGMNATIPWNNPNNLISLETEQLFDRIKATVLIPILFLIGFPANCINMAVFFKQGLKDRINLCLFSLALVDIVSLTVVFVFNAERLYTQFTHGKRIGEVYRYMISNNVVGIYGIVYGSMFLSAIISTERCICVLFPLRAQRCMPTKAIGFTIAVGVSALVFTRFAVTAMYQVKCFYEMRSKRVSWQPYVNKYYFRNKAMINVLDGVFYGFLLTVGCPVIVLTTTIITAIRLTQIVRWRSQTSSSLSSKEIGVTKMLIALSIEFFVLSIPLIVLRVFPVFQPRLRAGAEFANSFNLLVGFCEYFGNTSSAVNFFVYLYTGTKFRETLQGLIHAKVQVKSGTNCKSGSTETVTKSLTSADQTVHLEI